MPSDSPRSTPELIRTSSCCRVGPLMYDSMANAFACPKCLLVQADSSSPTSPTATAADIKREAERIWTDEMVAAGSPSRLVAAWFDSRADSVKAEYMERARKSLGVAPSVEPAPAAADEIEQRLLDIEREYAEGGRYGDDEVAWLIAQLRAARSSFETLEAVPEQHIAELEKACRCLYIAVDSVIADDVKRHADAVIADLRARSASLPSSIQPASPDDDEQAWDICVECGGSGAVRKARLTDDGELFDECRVCAGSGFRPTDAEIVALRSRCERLNDDLAAASIPSSIPAPADDDSATKKGGEVSVGAAWAPRDDGDSNPVLQRPADVLPDYTKASQPAPLPAEAHSPADDESSMAGSSPKDSSTPARADGCTKSVCSFPVCACTGVLAPKDSETPEATND